MGHSLSLGYTATWLLSVTIAITIVALRPRAYSLTQRNYALFLAQPWKLISFAISATGLTLIAPYTGDPTWDYVDASLMAILTFATAPWAVGVFYRTVTKKDPIRTLFVAINVWLFSASWSYDGYLFLRDGQYPSTWGYNLVASTVLYVLAGLFWNLEWVPGRGVVFAFMVSPWPSARSPSSFLRVAGFAVVIMLFVSMMIGCFVVEYLQTRP